MHLNIRGHGILLLTKQLQLNKTICISLKTVRGVQLPIVGCLFKLI